LQQAQKIEAIGRLAGGVAHDFNNMLGVIMGYTEMAQMKLDPSQPLYADLEEIGKAAERSAALTRQLLAFARKQTIEPKVLDLNVVVAGMLKMLQRLIGENVEISWLPGAALWQVLADPSQIDQMLANLCVNVRDAIADVGKATIETGNSVLDEVWCGTHFGSVPGEYVRISVKDNGSGMDNEVLEHLFEPFFTTKDTGKGTGLGLATVYGAVKQNNGILTVDSKTEEGTTFTIYLPRHLGNISQDRSKTAAMPTKGKNETILLVEDEVTVLEMTRAMLAMQGYTVLTATSPGIAFCLAREYSGKIDLLMTDVIMPEMNGRDLAGKLLTLYPDLKSLFMSGYTGDFVSHHGVLGKGISFIQKPFSLQGLTANVREVLDRT
jgi:CheY-like chemotaxis protein